MNDLYWLCYDFITDLDTHIPEDAIVEEMIRMASIFGEKWNESDVEDWINDEEDKDVES